MAPKGLLSILRKALEQGSARRALRGAKRGALRHETHSLPGAETFRGSRAARGNGRGCLLEGLAGGDLDSRGCVGVPLACVGRDPEEGGDREGQADEHCVEGEALHDSVGKDVVVALEFVGWLCLA